jgi:xylulokinase
MSEVFIGLDVGTTSVKAVAFDVDDSVVASAAHPTPTIRLNDGAEYDANALWSAAAAVLRDVTAQLGASHRAVAVAAASMAEAGVLVDQAGQPVGNVIAWFDARTEPQASWWTEVVGGDRTRRITGLSPRAVFGATKMLWTKEHRPDEWAAGHRWLNMADWIAFKLCGEAATDHSLASRTMLLDLAERRWSDELVDAAGLDHTKLAPLVASGTALGRVTDNASVETGLSTDVVVGVGGQDHVCAALALDVVQPAMLLDSIGTAEAFFLVMGEVDATGEVAATGINQGVHVEPGRTYAMTGLQHGGGRIDARRNELGLDWDVFLQTAEADEVIEEVAVDGQARIEALLTATGTSEVRHIVTGGGSRNTRLIERKRELGGRPIEVADQTQATALGAAKLARRAVEGKP